MSSQHFLLFSPIVLCPVTLSSIRLPLMSVVTASSHFFFGASPPLFSCFSLYQRSLHMSMASYRHVPGTLSFVLYGVLHRCVCIDLLSPYLSFALIFHLRFLSPEIFSLESSSSMLPVLSRSLLYTQISHPYITVGTNMHGK
jgi:hypothetical protein